MPARSAAIKRPILLCAALLVTLHAWMAATVSREHSATADELLHVTAGYSYWKFGDFRLQPENGNLPQRWAAFPLLRQDLKFPRTDQPAWRTADVAEIGYQFFYELGNDLPRMLASARMMVALLSLACGGLVFVWSRSLFGDGGALVSAALFAFCPNLLAHAGLATSDTAACLGFLAAVLTSWRLLHRVTVDRVLLTGGAAALLGLSKFSAPLLLVMLALMTVARAVRGAALPVRIGSWATRLRGWHATAGLGVAFAAAGVVGWALVWAGFNFRYAAVRGEGTLNRTWTEVMLDGPPVVLKPRPTDNAPVPAVELRPGAVQAIVRPLRKLHALPEGWLYGMAHVDRFARWRPAFFMGDYRVTGWLSYFPVAFLLKTPLPALALLVVAAGCLAVRCARRPGRTRLAYRIVPLAVLGGVYTVFALTTHLNIGHRHILPLYPLLYVLAGAVAFGFRRRWLALAAGGLLLWHAAASLAFRPDYLAYFNPLLGGPAHAYEHFVDSSLDWGQDLPGLKRWLDTHGRGERVFLSYFGSGSPEYEGIRASRIGDYSFTWRERQIAPPMTGGIYCLSATMFQQVYTIVRHGWNTQHEERYAGLRRWFDDWTAGREPTTHDEAVARLVELESLRFGRLCAGLRSRRPDAFIGYSILIFRLTDGEVRRLLEGPPPYTP